MADKTHKRPQEAHTPGTTPAQQTKRGKSEEPDLSPPVRELNLEDAEMTEPGKIKDLFDTLRDLKDDMRSQSNQLSIMLFTQVEKQRADCATKLLFNNFWKYADTAAIHTLQKHREAIVH